jgi:hypothetical protein
MKIAALALTLLGSLAVNATEMSIRISPYSPVVATADTELSNGVTVQGPWFKGDYLIDNFQDDAITLTGLDFVVTSAEGKALHSTFSFNSPVQINSGEFYSLRNLYLGSLPKSDSYVYRVEVRPIGWEGNIDNPGDALDTTLNFVTQ